MKGKRILVTGAGGFIGYNLSNALADRGHEVTGIDVHYPKRPGPGREVQFRAVTGDFRDAELMHRLLSGQDLLFHLASAHLDVSLLESEYWNINVHSVPHLLEQARRNGLERCIHVSSVGIYGRLQKWPADEETPCRPQSIYGRTKLAGEAAVLEFTRRTGFSVVILRPAWVYGPGCPRTLKLYRTLHKRRFPMIGRGTNLRHPLFIDDFLVACELASDSEAEHVSGRAYVIAGEQAITSHELIETYCRELDLPRPVLKIPYPVGRLMATSAEALFGLLGREPPLSRRTLEFFDTDNAFDISRARNELNYRPAYNFAAGLKATRSWLVQNS